MAELTRKKQVRGGHKSSITKTIRKAEELLAALSDHVQLSRFKMSLQEKLEVVKNIDAGILELLEGEAVVTAEIEEADAFKEEIYAALVRIDELLEPSRLSTTVAVVFVNNGFQMVC